MNNKNKKSISQLFTENTNKDKNRVFARQLTRQLTRTEQNNVSGGVTCVSTGYPKTEDYDCGF